jgi:hypothetical protein
MLARVIADGYSGAGNVAILEPLLFRTQQLRGFVIDARNIVAVENLCNIAVSVFQHIKDFAFDDASTEKQTGDTRRFVILLASETIQKTHLNYCLSFAGAHGGSHRNRCVLYFRSLIDHTVADEQIVISSEELVFTRQAKIIVGE